MLLNATTWKIARDGQIFGPYTLLELQRHLVSGHVVATDLAQGDTMDEWLPVSALFPEAAMQDERIHPGGLPRLFPDPPNLRWWIVLLLGLLTFNIFSVVWDLYEAFWLRRVERGSVAFWFYLVSAGVFLIKLQSTWHSILYNIGLGPAPDNSYSLLFTIATILLAVVSRLVFRRELLRHFNSSEPIGLHLNWLMSVLFGALYFQYHFNRINDVKRALRISVPAS